MNLKINNIVKQQFKILKLAKTITYRQKNNFFYDENYLACWSNNLGSLILKDKFKNKKSYFLFFLINILNYISFQKNYKITYFFNKNIKYKNLIFSYHTRNSNILYDDFFSTNINKTKNSLWIIFNLSNDKNIVLKKNNIILINLFSLSKFKKIIFFPFFLIKFFYFFLFNIKIYNKNLFKTFDSIVGIIKTNLIDNPKFYLPFESQPHQLYLLEILKKNKPKIKTFGYLHSCLPPLPTEFFFKKHLDKIIVHGVDQLNILIKYLGWKKNKILLMKSFRYIASDIKKGSIYLPYSFHSPNLILDNIKFIFDSEILNNSYNFYVANHPHRADSKKHNKLLKDINLLISKYKKDSQNVPEYSIFIGATASLVEALEMNIKVLHVSSNPEFEFHNSKIWKSFFIKKINPNINLYKLHAKGKIINFGKKNNFLKKFAL
jgi:hypothetical protein